MFDIYVNNRNTDGNNGGNDSTYSPETSDAILDTAKVKYTEEQERFKQVEIKTNITLAFSGVLLGTFLNYIQNNPLNLENIWYVIYTVIFKLTILYLLSFSVVKFFKSITVGNFSQIGLDNIVDEEFASVGVSKSKLEIAATYRDAINENKEKLVLHSEMC